MADLWAWQLSGSCRKVDPAVFFHPDGERGSARARGEAFAKKVCTGCPVLRQCRSHALRAHEPYDAWGGLSELDRERLYARHGGSRSAG